ncbi:MAG: PspA/IM30 family protein [Eubacterium sp.]|nr:PspA/IM30 family protein [Eubacterium sp.]
MASILKRFKDIMAANINQLLDRAEDPEKMIDQYLRDMESDLGRVKAETTAVMAEATKANRQLDELKEEISKMEKYAEKALIAGNETDAKTFLERKAQLSKDLAYREQMAANADANAQKMKQMHDKLARDIDELNDRKASIKAKVAAAKAQEKINELTEKVGNIDTSSSEAAFDRMEEKANKMLDEANARAELNESAAHQTVKDLQAKYDTENNPDVDSELEALKAKLGL